MITKKEVKTYLERWIHDDCGGEFFPNGQAYLSNPPNYPHICNKCGQKQVASGTRFPHTSVEEIRT